MSVQNAIAAVALAALVAGCSAGGASTTTTSTSGNSSVTESSSPTEDATDTPTPTYSPAPADFKIAIKIRKKECFGSAGCNITYRIDPTYSGLPLDGTWDVTYSVQGGDSGPQVNTFTITGDQASFDSEEMVSTPSLSTKLTAKVTDVAPE